MSWINLHPFYFCLSCCCLLVAPSAHATQAPADGLRGGSAAGFGLPLYFLNCCLSDVLFLSVFCVYMCTFMGRGKVIHSCKCTHTLLQLVRLCSSEHQEIMQQAVLLIGAFAAHNDGVCLFIPLMLPMSYEL